MQKLEKYNFFSWQLILYQNTCSAREEIVFLSLPFFFKAKYRRVTDFRLIKLKILHETFPVDATASIHCCTAVYHQIPSQPSLHFSLRSAGSELWDYFAVVARFCSLLFINYNAKDLLPHVRIGGNFPELANKTALLQLCFSHMCNLHVRGWAFT